jgi:hypothetical protein
MFAETKLKQEVCPFTLEPCEVCRERKILGNQEICSFTLEPCRCHMAGCLLPIASDAAPAGSLKDIPVTVSPTETVALL